jgi:DNA mismatch repair protein MutL
MITMTAEDIQVVRDNVSIFIGNGIIVEPFGHNQLVLKATPVHLKNSNVSELIENTIAWIYENNNIELAELEHTVNKKLHARMACAAAVKAGDVLTIEQMQTLINDLHACAYHLTCPHGRPTGWVLTTHEIEKKFKRNYESRR